MLVAPVLEDLVRGAEAGPRVDHRGAADGLRDRNRDRRVAFGDRQPARRGRGSRSLRAGPPGRSRGRKCSPASSTITSSPASARVAAAAAPPAPEPTITTSHSSPSPAGSVSPSAAGRLRQGAVGEPAADLDPDPLLDLGLDGVAERREELRHQQQLVVEAEARALHPLQEVVAGGGVEAAEAPGEGQPLEGAQAELQPGQHPRRDRARGTRRPGRRRRCHARPPAGRRFRAPSPRRSRSGCAARRPRAPARAFSPARGGGRCGRSATRARARAGRASRRRGS